MNTVNRSTIQNFLKAKNDYENARNCARQEHFTTKIIPTQIDRLKRRVFGTLDDSFSLCFWGKFFEILKKWGRF